MKKARFIGRIAALAWLAVRAGPVAAEPRVWTDAQGKTVEAEFVRLDGATVYLRGADGKVFWAVLGMLSEADQQYVRAQVPAPAAPADPAAPRAPAKLQVEGTFEWNGRRGEQHDLEGTLTPDGDKQWTAVWKFKWNNRPMTYTGVVTGDPRNGKISGTGVDGRARRTFTFEGTAKDGVWTFLHYETTRGAPQATGPGTARLKN